MISHISRFRFLFFTGVFFILWSCGPRIRSFLVEPLVVFPEDSVKVSWSVSGQPTLLVYDRHQGGDTLYRQFTLSVIRNGKEVGRHIQVQVLSKGDTDIIAFLTAAKQDSLIAAGIKNTARWSTRGRVLQISNTNGRPIDVIHDGRVVHLETGAKANALLEGTAIAGSWTLRTLMSASEQADPKLRPDRLRLQITIKPN